MILSVATNLKSVIFGNTSYLLHYGNVWKIWQIAQLLFDTFFMRASSRVVVVEQIEKMLARSARNFIQRA